MKGTHCDIKLVPEMATDLMIYWQRFSGEITSTYEVLLMSST